MFLARSLPPSQAGFLSHRNNAGRDRVVIRLQKFLAEAGIASRRKCESLILEGKIFVNGKRASIGQSISPEKDRIVFQGKEVKAARCDYILLHKPKGYLSTVSDPFLRNTILDLVKMDGRVYPVGRLDKNSEGLMLLTNDGELAYRLTHPKFQVEKVYDVWVKGVPDDAVLKRLRDGILLEDGMTSPCVVRRISSSGTGRASGGKGKCLLEIKLHEGRKREIRRMMEKVGHGVVSLCRVAIGPLKLGSLLPGQWRSLSPSEADTLKKFVSENV